MPAYANRAEWLFLFVILAVSPCWSKDSLQLSPSRKAQGDNAFPLDTLQNVTGTFKGTWRKTVDGLSRSIEILSEDTGSVYFRVLDVRPQNASLHYIQGELTLQARSGQQDEDSITFSLEGIYVEDSQHVHAIARTDAPELLLPIDADEYASQLLPYRQALARMARQYLHLAEKNSKGALRHDSAYLAPISKQCELVLDLKVRLPHKVLGKQPKQKYILMNGTAISSECGIGLEVGAKSTHLDAFIRKATRYIVMMSAVTVIQVWLVTQQMTTSGTQSQMSNTAMLMISPQTVLDAFLCLLHLSLGIMVEPVFSPFATLAFFEFVLFALFEMKYMLTIWKANRPQNADMRSQQRELLALYIRFYLALVLSVFLAYALQRFVKLLVFAAFSFWLPQIVYSLHRDARQPLKLIYLGGMSVTRLILPFYMFGCPHSIPGLHVSPVYCAILTGWVGIQVLLLVGQSRFGPRFFVPKQLLPPKYDYFRPFSARQLAESPRQGPKDIETGDAGHECVICMTPLDIATNSARMITPCNHIFHPACLQRWMLVKMECPTCRSSLPPE